MKDEQWNAIVNRDKSYDGVFYWGCKKTKIVCRPSCTTKIADRDNVEVFDDLDSAIAAGYRCCYRCRPEKEDWQGTTAELAKNVKWVIEQQYAEKFSLERLEDTLHVNADYLARVFRKEMGITPLHYHNYVRCEKAKELLRSSDQSVSMISYDVGYATPSHFAKVFKSINGQTPLEYRKMRRIEQ
ncbi:MAG: helix-turn-helix domain-containing protein [Lachnospiraceae bacterium]|nr:helix-turn-helix domain-containing protein [Lachnospiraceae bacterium]